LQQAPELLSFFFRAPIPGEDGFDPAMLIPKRFDKPQTADLLRAIHAALNSEQFWTPSSLEETLRALCESLELKPGPLFGTLRVAVSGRSVAPPLFEMLSALGRDEVLARVAAAALALE
jgi:glutamyl-tRNA synthetase